MLTFRELEQKIKERGVTQSAVCSHLGINRTAFGAWRRGVNQSWQKYLPEIAEFLHMSVDELMGNAPQAPKPPILADLPPNVNLLPKTKKVPIIGVISCGEPILAVENIEDYISVPESIHCDYALMCKGDSMINARIYDGDIVYIRQQEDVDDGEIAAVLIGDETTLKRVRKYPDKVCLMPENPTYPTLTYEGEQMGQLRIIGKAIAFTSVVR